MIVIFFSRFDYTKLKKYGKPLYVINLLMLVAVMFIGTSASGPALDSVRAYYPAAVGVFETHHDHLHGSDPQRPRRPAQ